MSFDAFERMLRAQRGLELVLAGLPAGATLGDARDLHRRLKQVGRAPCTFLDDELAIEPR